MQNETVIRNFRIRLSQPKFRLSTSDILVLKLILVLVFILFSNENFYFIQFQFFGSIIILVFIQFFGDNFSFYII